MRIVVCAKQVPEHPDRLDPATRTLVRSGRPALDDADAVGVELALRIASASEGAGGEIVLISMGPADEVAGLRAGLALGASRAVIVSDPALAGADALTTARVLGAVVRRLQPVDLVLAGTESTDGYTGVLGSQLAEVLGHAAVTFARRVELAEGEVRAERQTEAGYDEVVCPLPCVVTVTSGAAVPRYPSFKSIVSARSKPVEVLDLADLGLEPAVPDQEVVDVAAATAPRQGEIVDDGGQGHERILDALVDLKLL